MGIHPKEGIVIRYAVLDFETNGFVGRSVVSASSIVFDDGGNVLGYFNRFYFPRERPDWRTERIHGLTVPRLERLRRNAGYPEHFPEDIDSLVDFWERLAPDGIVVHNLSFDSAFLPATALEGRKWWCSMRGLVDVCAIAHPGRPGTSKWPRLQEAADRIATLFPPLPPIRRAEESLASLMRAHASLADCFVLGRIMSRIVQYRSEVIRFRKLRGSKFLLPARSVYLRSGTGVEDAVTQEILKFENAFARLLKDGEGTLRTRVPSPIETPDLPFSVE